MKLTRAFALTLLTLLISLAAAKNACAAPVCTKNGELAQQLKLPIYEWSDPELLCKGNIIAVHGLTFYAAAYDDLASYLAERGYRFIALDIRGFGRWREEKNQFDGDDQVHFGRTADDVRKIAEILRREEPEQKLFAMGESLGANITLDVVSRDPKLCDGLILGSPCYKTRVHPKPRWVIDFCKGIRHPNRPLNLTPYITPYLSDDKELTQACLKDEHICRQLSPVELIKAAKTNSWSLANVDKFPPNFPILVLAGEKDGVFKTDALPELLDRFGTHAIDVNIFPERGHLLLEHQAVNMEISSIFDRWLSRQTQEERVVVHLGH